MIIFHLWEHPACRSSLSFWRWGRFCTETVSAAAQSGIWVAKITQSSVLGRQLGSRGRFCTLSANCSFSCSLNAKGAISRRTGSAGIWQQSGAAGEGAAPALAGSLLPHQTNCWHFSCYHHSPPPLVPHPLWHPGRKTGSWQQLPVHIPAPPHPCEHTNTSLLPAPYLQHCIYSIIHPRGIQAVLGWEGQNILVIQKVKMNVNTL